MPAPLFKNLQILNSRGRQQRGNYCTWLSVVFSSNCGWPAREEAHQWPHEVIQEPREAGRQRVRGRGAEVRADAAADHGRGEQLASLTPALSHGQANMMSQVREPPYHPTTLWQYTLYSVVLVQDGKRLVLNLFCLTWKQIMVGVRSLLVHSSHQLSDTVSVPCTKFAQLLRAFGTKKQLNIN